MQFIPNGVTTTSSLPDVPYFEDSAKHNIAGRRTDKPVEKLQREVEAELSELGGYRIRFAEGQYQDNARRRHGYRITFLYAGNEARIDVAALPMRSETPTRRKQAMAQALYLLRDWLIAERLSWVYRPSAMPLLPYITGADGRTVIEVMAASGTLPLLGSGA